MKLLIILLLLIPINLISKAPDKQEYTPIEDANERDKYNNSRKLWIADCYLKARKDSEIKSDNDAIYVNKHCTTLGYEKYPEKEFFIIPKKE
jgi:hypothetical protein